MKKQLKLPKFKNEDEEADFWNNLDLTEYFEPSDFVRVSFPRLKLTPKKSAPISIPVRAKKAVKERAIKKA